MVTWVFTLSRIINTQPLDSMASSRWYEISLDSQVLVVAKEHEHLWCLYSLSPNQHVLRTVTQWQARKLTLCVHNMTLYMQYVCTILSSYYIYRLYNHHNNQDTNSSNNLKIFFMQLFYKHIHSQSSTIFNPKQPLICYHPYSFIILKMPGKQNQALCGLLVLTF